MAKKSATRKAGKGSHAGKQRASAMKKASPSKAQAALKPGRGEKLGQADNPWQKTLGQGGVDATKSKSGCFPKLLMLVLPIIAYGANLLLR